MYNSLLIENFQTHVGIADNPLQLYTKIQVYAPLTKTDIDCGAFQPSEESTT